MAKTRSMPTLIPTQGICFDSPANRPTRSSYLPPPQIDPTPTDSEISSSGFAGFFFEPSFVELVMAVVGGGGGADAEVTTSKISPV
jgi:hypothetical protein